MITVIDRRKDGNGDEFVTDFETEVEAVKNAIYEWNHLTKSEQEEREIIVCNHDKKIWEITTVLMSFE